MDWPNLFSILRIVVFVVPMVRCCGGMARGGCGGRGEEQKRKQPGRDSKPEETAWKHGRAPKTMNLEQRLAFLLAAVLLASSASAQETPPVSTRAPAAPAQPGAMETQGMDRMSDSVTKMSEMCQMMMKKEMAAIPYKMVSGIGLGVLLLIALVLFVILEIPWIIYWSRLLKAQKHNVFSPPR